LGRADNVRRSGQVGQTHSCLKIRAPLPDPSDEIERCAAALNAGKSIRLKRTLAQCPHTSLPFFGTTTVMSPDRVAFMRFETMEDDLSMVVLGMPNWTGVPDVCTVKLDDGSERLCLELNPV